MLKQYKSELAIGISIAGGVVILIISTAYIKSAFDAIKQLTSVSGINNEYIMFIIRIMAIAYITEIGVSIAKDAGESALATKVELGGKLVIFTLCVPILFSLIEMVTGMLG